MARRVIYPSEAEQNEEESPVQARRREILAHRQEWHDRQMKKAEHFAKKRQRQLKNPFRHRKWKKTMKEKFAQLEKMREDLSIDDRNFTRVEENLKNSIASFFDAKLPKYPERIDHGANIVPPFSSKRQPSIGNKHEGPFYLASSLAHLEQEEVQAENQKEMEALRPIASIVYAILRASGIEPPASESHETHLAGACNTCKIMVWEHDKGAAKGKCPHCETKLQKASIGTRWGWRKGIGIGTMDNMELVRHRFAAYPPGEEE